MRPSTNQNLLLPLPGTPTALPEFGRPSSDEVHIFQPDEPPSQNSLRRLANYPLYDSSGASLPLSSLFSPTCLRKTRMLLIFIRNFFCGNCQQYLVKLNEVMPPSSLPADTALAIIGCGAPTLLPSYLELTHCPYPIYTDPSAQLYPKLNMQRTLKMGDYAPDYIHTGIFVSSLQSIVQGLKRLPKGDVRKAGNMDQNGGEFLFVRREGSVGWGGDCWADDWRVTWCHRMRNTRDHTEAARLRIVLGIDKDPSQKWPLAAGMTERDRYRTVGKPWANGSKTTTKITSPAMGKENEKPLKHKRSTTLSSLRTLTSNGNSNGTKRHRVLQSISNTISRPGTSRTHKKSASASPNPQQMSSPFVSEQDGFDPSAPAPRTVAMAAWDRPEELKSGYSDREVLQKSESHGRPVQQPEKKDKKISKSKAKDESEDKSQSQTTRILSATSREQPTTRKRATSRSKAAAQVLNLRLAPITKGNIAKFNKSTDNVALGTGDSESHVAIFSVVTPAQTTGRPSVSAARLDRDVYYTYGEPGTANGQSSVRSSLDGQLGSPLPLPVGGPVGGSVPIGVGGIFERMGTTGRAKDRVQGLGMAVRA
ncbi:Thioredoxin-like protein AAED1 [Cyphellophora attinorum]|uniref:Thioredoxin-like protein AAED1 n=1 Tax=Cyphellophora attinorum TaxID=1664694 RepID=A0A0N1NXQ5_9EURO|nr:Thioredoxin-like protein AAED1 [Phialophora attinorum]KPI35886.1 Thioredoxin-like protein AAED1 [Phialophora attinorum]